MSRLPGSFPEAEDLREMLVRLQFDAPPPILFRAIRDEWVFTTTEICFIQELLGAFEGLYGVFLRK
ncbi:hypothetical protein ACFLZU_03635 [Thermodesulfobacteriota bacterium]